ncbi:MAG: type 1 glutamine amidotransferase, partial [Geodermatophilaceae bacterium]
VFARVPFTPDVLQWHYDEISRLPAGAVLLASSPAYVNQAFRIGECAWGLQFHIETTPDMVGHWVAADTGQAAEWGLDLAALTEKAVAAHDDIAQVWAPAMSRFADVVHSRASAASAAG